MPTPRPVSLLENADSPSRPPTTAAAASTSTRPMLVSHDGAVVVGRFGSGPESPNEQPPTQIRTAMLLTTASELLTNDVPRATTRDRSCQLRWMTGWSVQRARR